MCLKFPQPREVNFPQATLLVTILAAPDVLPVTIMAAPGVLLVTIIAVPGVLVTITAAPGVLPSWQHQVC